MRKLIRRLRHDERGASLAVAAVMIMSLLSMIALAMDLGLLRTARAEAQRAADSGALAGVQEFLHYVNPEDAVGPATQKAHEFAEMNHIRNVLIDESEVTVEVNAEYRQVYVLVRRPAIPMWFARIFGIDYRPIAASAKAEASPASNTDCVAPIAISDWWEETDTDADGDGIPDLNEVWEFDPSTDRYKRFNWDEDPDETGFGSTWRHAPRGDGVIRDRGRQMVIKPQAPAGQTDPVAVQPGFFYMLDFPESAGARGWWDNLVASARGECPWGDSAVGEGIPIEPGVNAGPVWMAFQEVYDMDPGARWDPVTEQVVDINGDPNPDSERILTFAIYDPHEIHGLQGKAEVPPNNFGYFFLEARPRGPRDDVVGRFITYVSGYGGGQTGSLVLQPRLIQ